MILKTVSSLCRLLFPNSYNIKKSLQSMGRTVLLLMQQQWRLLLLVRLRGLWGDALTTQGTSQTGLSDSTLRMMSPAYVGLIPVQLPGIYRHLPLPAPSLWFDERCNNKFNLNVQLPWLFALGRLLYLALFLDEILQNKFLLGTSAERVDSDGVRVAINTK